MGSMGVITSHRPRAPKCAAVEGSLLSTAFRGVRGLSLIIGAEYVPPLLIGQKKTVRTEDILRVLGPTHQCLLR